MDELWRSLFAEAWPDEGSQRLEKSGQEGVWGSNDITLVYQNIHLDSVTLETRYIARQTLCHRDGKWDDLRLGWQRGSLGSVLV